MNNEYKLNALRWHRCARLRWVGERADAQLLTWWGDCGVCLYTLKTGPYYCLSVILSASLLYCFAVCVCARASVSMNEAYWHPLLWPSDSWQLQSVGWVGDEGRGGGVSPQRTFMMRVCVCLGEVLCVCDGVTDTSALHANCCCPLREVHRKQHKSFFFQNFIIHKFVHVLCDVNEDNTLL